MFDGLWFRGRTAGRRRAGSLVADSARTPVSPGVAAFDEFSAPEGGFGRLDALLGEHRAVAATLASATGTTLEAQRRIERHTLVTEQLAG